jgi:hypothetical protein
MTRDWRPSGAATNADDDQWFEALATVELRRLPTRAWENMDALWRQLPSAWPSTQRRLLAYILEEAVRRGEPLSAKFVKRFVPHVIRVLSPTQARSRIHNIEAARRAAAHLAKNPRASLNDLARAAGVGRDIVRQWRQFPKFKRLLRDEELIADLDAPERKFWKVDEAASEALASKSAKRRRDRRFKISRPVYQKKL